METASTHLPEQHAFPAISLSIPSFYTITRVPHTVQTSPLPFPPFSEPKSAFFVKPAMNRAEKKSETNLRVRLRIACRPMCMRAGYVHMSISRQGGCGIGDERRRKAQRAGGWDMAMGNRVRRLRQRCFSFDISAMASMCSRGFKLVGWLVGAGDLC